MVALLNGCSWIPGPTRTPHFRRRFRRKACVSRVIGIRRGAKSFAASPICPRPARRLRVTHGSSHGPPPSLAISPEQTGASKSAWNGASPPSSSFICTERLPVTRSDCTVVAATSGRVEENTLTPRQFAETLDRTAAGGPAAVVFGPEDNGLTTAERRLCHVTVRIPSAPEQPSLNLAQAVLVLAYELSMVGCPEQAELRERVSAAEFETVMDALRGALVEIGYLNHANPHAIMAELRDLFWRGAPTAREIALLRGLARQVAWAARQARQTGDGGRV